jgi:phosphoenolpyruvate synthase/pyruvate phosphate dikinase
VAVSGAIGVTPIGAADDLAAFGTKAVSLARMSAAGLPVPGGFCIPADAYREHALRAGVPDLLSVVRAIPSEAPAMSTTAVLQRIRASIVRTALDPALTAVVRDAFDALGDGAVSVRSSVTVEDMPSGPLVGKHGTFFAPGYEDALRAVAHCWTSLWSDPAWRHRRDSGLADTDVAVAVVIQKLVAARSSGVVFTADPETGDPDRIVIEGCYGLGEAIEAGKVAPDRFVIDRATLEPLDAWIEIKPVELVVDETGRVHERAVTQKRTDAPCLTESELRQVAELGIRAEPTVGGGAAAVEWACADDGCWLLQARPLVVGRG